MLRQPHKGISFTEKYRIRSLLSEVVPKQIPHFTPFAVSISPKLMRQILEGSERLSYALCTCCLYENRDLCLL